MAETPGFDKKLLVEIEGAPASGGKVPIKSDDILDVSVSSGDINVVNSVGVNIEDVSPTSGKLPVEANLNGQVVSVTPGIMKTFHVFDQTPVTEEDVGTTYVLFKTISLAGKFLKEVIFSVDKKDVFFKLEIDSDMVSEAEIEFLYDNFNPNDDGRFSKNFLVFKNKVGDYVFAICYDNCKIATDVKVYLKSSSGAQDITMAGLAYVYEEKITT